MFPPNLILVKGMKCSVHSPHNVTVWGHLRPYSVYLHPTFILGHSAEINTSQIIHAVLYGHTAVW